jgi:hypothetical protein
LIDQNPVNKKAAAVRQDPAKSMQLKMKASCHKNGQGPPLLRNCNHFIIEKSNYPKKAGVPQMQCEQRADYVLDPHFPLAESLLINGPALSERRSKPRAAGPLQARVWGVDSDDHPFSFDCQLDNISASGLYLRLPRKMSFSSAISLVVRLLHGPFEGMSAAIKGTVIRNEHGPGGDTGIGVRILEHRFI